MTSFFGTFPTFREFSRAGVATSAARAKARLEGFPASRLKNEVRISVLALTRGELNIISVFNLFYKLFEAIKMPSSQLDTPQKNKIRGAAEFCEKQGIKFTKTSLATTFETTRDQVTYALASDTSRTGRSSISKKENPRKLTERDLDHVEVAIEANGPEGHELD